MCWRTAELERRLRVTLIVWGGFVAATLLWMLCCGDLASVAAFAGAPWVVALHAQLRWLSAVSMYPFYALFAGLMAWGWYRRQPQLRVIGWGYLIAQVCGSVLLVRILKTVFGHARPDFTYSGGDLFGKWVGLTWDASFQGFPSGHTTDIFISTIFLSMLVPKDWMRVAVLCFAAFNGALRIALAKHYPVDVLGGVLLGGLAALLTWELWVMPRLRCFEGSATGIPSRV